MKDENLKAMLDAVCEVIKEYAPSRNELSEVAATIKQYDPPKDGTSVTVDDVAPLIAQQVSKAVEALPAAKDGKDVDLGEVTHMVVEAVSALPPAKDGQSVTAEDVAPLIASEVAKAMASIPLPKDGPTAEDVAKMLEGKFAEWALGFERKADALFQRAIDRMPTPEPGKDGRDFGDVDFSYDGARGITMRYQKDGEPVEQTYRMPVVIDAGFFKEGEGYEKGDGVTFGGSYWIAQKDTAAKPEIGSEDWRLAVKKGRDAKHRGEL